MPGNTSDLNMPCRHNMQGYTQRCSFLSWIIIGGKTYQTQLCHDTALRTSNPSPLTRTHTEEICTRTRTQARQQTETRLHTHTRMQLSTHAPGQMQTLAYASNHNATQSHICKNKHSYEQAPRMHADMHASTTCNNTCLSIYTRIRLRSQRSVRMRMFACARKYTNVIINIPCRNMNQVHNGTWKHKA